MTGKLLVCSTALLLFAGQACAGEQSWAKRTPPPVKYASPPPEQQQHDWSGFHIGVNAGSGFNTSGRNSAVPGKFNLSR